MRGAAAFVLVVLLALAAIAGRAAADSGADEAEARFQRGTQLYKQQRYDEALLEFFASQRLVPNKNVVFNIARTYESMARHDLAYRYYAEYLLVADLEARERKIADDKLQALRPFVALLRIESTPPGATVYVDRKDLGGRGETPLVLALSEGRHVVLLERAEHEPAQGEAVLERGREVTVRLTLAPVVGEVTVSSRPATTEIRVDRSDGDDAPADARAPTTLRLAPGRHSLELRAPGHRPQRHEVVVAARGTRRLEVRLEPIPLPSGTLAIRASEPGALVLVDGRTVGVTPTVLTVGAGTRIVEVRRPGFQTWTRSIAVTDGVREFLDVVLKVAEPEVVGATRTAQRLGDAPASVSLVHAAEIEQLGDVQLADALAGVRGLYDSYDRTYRYTGIRGFSRPGDYTNRVLILRDGHVVNDDWVGQGSVGRELAIDLGDVSRVEVVRGPGSAFYGQGAFFGVVNVVSMPAGSAPGLRATTAAASDGGVRASVRGAATTSTGGAGVSVGGAIYRSDGQSLEFPGVYPGFARDTDGERVASAFVRARAGDFELDAEWNQREKDIPTGEFDSIFDPVHEGPGVPASQRDERLFVDGRWHRDVRGVALGARVYYDHLDYQGVYPYEEEDGDVVFRENARSDSGGSELRVAFDLPGRQRVTLGAEMVAHRVDQSYDEDENGSDDLPDPVHRFVTASAYVVDELRVAERLQLTAGVRLDRAGPDALVSVSPRVAAVLTPYAGGRSKVIVGRAFRAPSVYELYYNDGGVTQKVPPDGLGAETVITAELEHTHELGANTYVLGSVFGSRIEGLINLVEDPDDGLLVYASSAERVWAMGVELEARRGWKSGAYVGAALSLTRLVTDDVEVRTNSVPVGASVKAFYPLDAGFGLGTRVVYTVPRPDREGGESDHAVRADLVASGKVAGASGVSFRVGVYNVFDDRYDIPVGADFKQVSIEQDGRTFMAEVSYAH